MKINFLASRKISTLLLKREARSINTLKTGSNQMFFHQTDSKKLMPNWAFFPMTLGLLFLGIPNSGKAEESVNQALPPSPDTGTPEEEVLPGGTRDSSLMTKICGEPNQEIAYLLGDKNREFTLSAYPTFWFYIPNQLEKVAQLKFQVKELQTGKKVYHRAVSPSKMAGVIGISIPPEPEYAVVTNTNYSWSIEADCMNSNYESVMLLEGWLHRLPLNPDLQNQLAAVPDIEKHTVYFQHDLLYDALNDLAQLRIAEPNNSQFKNSWNELLVELGWRDLGQGFKSIADDTVPYSMLKRI